MDDERIKLILDLGQSGADVKDVREELEKLDAAAHKTADGVTKLTPAQKEAAKASAEMQRGFLSLTNAAQDFQAAGLNGILNNIPQIVMQFGGSAGLAAAIGGVAVACYAGQKAFDALWGALVSGVNDVPKVTDKLGQMNAELKTNKDRLKELSDQGSLTNAQLAEYNVLLTENVELERQANAEKERRNGIDAARKKEVEGDPQAGGIVQAAIGEAGGIDNVNNATRIKLLGESANVRDARANFSKVADQNAEAAANPLNPLAQVKALVAIRKAQADLDAETKKVEDQATDLVLAASKGRQAAVAELARLHGGAFAQATPEAIQSQDAEVEAVDAQGQALHKGNARRKAAGAQVDALNRAGQENEAALGRDQQKESADELKRLNGILDKAIASNDKFLGKDDRAGDARRADIQERAGYGIDFKNFAKNQGFSPLKSDLADAARSIQADVKDGMSEDQALQNAMNKLIDTVSKGIEINNRRVAMARRFQTQVDNLPVQLAGEGDY